MAKSVPLEEGLNMSVRDLVDTFPISLSLEEGESGKIRIRGPFGHCEVPTANNRRYGRKVMESNIKALGESMRRRRVFGELDHPADGATSLKRVSHIITDLKIESDGQIVGVAEPLPTPYGQVLMALAKANCELGISSRGRGSTVTTDEGIDEVQDDYVLKTFDFVDNPASKNAYLTFESDEGRAALIESVGEEHRDDIRAALEEAAKEAETFRIEDIEDPALRELVRECMCQDKATDASGGNESEDEPKEPEKEESEGSNGEVEQEAVETEEADDEVFGGISEGSPGDIGVQRMAIKQILGQLRLTPHTFHRVASSKEETEATVQLRDKASLKFHATTSGLKWSLSQGNKVVASGEAKYAGTIKKITDPIRAALDDLFKGESVEEDEDAIADSDLVAERDRLAEEVERLKHAVSTGLESATQQIRDELSEQIRAELIRDPQVVGSRTIVEAIAAMVSEFIAPDDEVMALRRQVAALEDLVQITEFDAAQVKLEADDKMQEVIAESRRFVFESKIAGHPKADAIRRMVGDASKLTEEEIGERTAAAFSVLGDPPSVTDLRRRLREAVELGTKIEEANTALTAKLEAEIEKTKGLKQQLVEVSRERDRLSALVESVPDARRVSSLVESEDADGVRRVARQNRIDPDITRAMRKRSASSERQVPRQDPDDGATLHEDEDAGFEIDDGFFNRLAGIE